MKLATLRDGSRDGRLVVVSSDLARAVDAKDVSPTLQNALDRWDDVEQGLRELASSLEEGPQRAFPFDMTQAAAPLPRAYQFFDAGCYLNHMELVRKSRNADMPPNALEEPAMYQGLSDTLAGPNDPIVCDDEWGIDFEAEVAAITGDVPLGVGAEDAVDYIRLVTFINDVTLRNLAPFELQKGFGFLQSKPTTAFAPIAMTPDELGPAWQDGKLVAPVRVTVNDEVVGQPVSGVDMQFDFGAVIAYGAKTRSLSAGTIVGTGTVSNRDRNKGVACLVERRSIEMIESGEIATQYLKYGDRIRIEMFDEGGRSLMGRIDQVVTSLDDNNRLPRLE